MKERGLKITPQRVAVIEVLIEKGDLHPGAALIYEEARKKKKGVSLSTVYATLDALSRSGIIKALQFDGKENRYENDLEEHINLICKRCEKIVDYRAPLAVDRQGAAVESGFSVTDVRLEYHGYCLECRDDRANEGGS
jgi:Fe2+ or Zn2+ uptake regulation protein